MIELIQKLEFRSGRRKIRDGGKQKYQNSIDYYQKRGPDYSLQFYEDSLFLYFYSSLDFRIDHFLIPYGLDVNVTIQTRVDFVLEVFFGHS